MDSDIGGTFVATFVARRMLMDEVYGSTNALLEFTELSGTNYKFLDKKMHLQSLWTYVFKAMDLSDTNYKLIDLKMQF